MLSAFSVLRRSRPPRNPSHPPHLGLVFSGQILHQVVERIVLEQGIGLDPGLIAAHQSSQRRCSVSERVAEILASSYDISIVAQRRKQEISTNAQIYREHARCEIDDARSPLPIS